MLPAGVIVAGGVALLPGLLSVIKDNLRLPVRLARPLHLDGVVDIAADPSFAVATGLVLWGFETEMGGGKKAPSSSFGNGSLVSKVLDWCKSFLP